MSEPIETSSPSKVGVSRSYGSVLLVISKAANAILGLISVPIMLGVLGDEAYGAIVFVLLVQGVMGLTDIGASEFIQRQMSAAIGKKDDQEVAELNRDQYAINLVTGVLLLLVGIACGLLIPLNRGGIGFTEGFCIFMMLGLQSGLFRANQVFRTLLGAYQRFDLLSLGWVIHSFFVNIASIAGVLIIQRPWAYVLGILLGEFVSFAYLMAKAKQHKGWTPVRFNWRWNRLKPTLTLCATEYPNRVAGFFASFGDKFMLGTATLTDLAIFRNASRPPEVIREMFIPLADTSLPGLSRDYHRSKQAFYENALFSGRVVFFATILTILVPAGLATPLLQIWLGKNAPPTGETIFIQMAVYQSFQMYLAIMGIALFAAAKRPYLIPLTALNAIMSLTLTLPVYDAYGLLGIGWIKIAVGMIQVLGLWFVLVKIGFSKADVLRHLSYVLAIAAMGGLFVVAGLGIANSPYVVTMPWLAIPIAPLLILVAMMVMIKMRIGILPDRIENRLLGIKRKFLPKS